MGVVGEIESDAFGGRRLFWGNRKSCFFLREAVIGKGVKKIEKVGDVFVG